MTVAAFPALSLPAFLSDRLHPGSVACGVSNLVHSARAALVVVDASSGLLDEVVAAAPRASRQILVLLRPGTTVPRHLDGSSDRTRVLAVPWGEPSPELVVLLHGDASDLGLRLVMAAGTASGREALGGVGIFGIDRQTGYEVQQWFSSLWSAATPLGPDTPDAPAMAVENASLARQWEAFRERLRASDENVASGAAQAGRQKHPAQGAGDAGEVATDAMAAMVVAPANQQGVVAALEQPSVLEREVTALYQRGHLVSIDVTQKVPTFRLNVVEVLGLPKQSRSGRAVASSPVHLDLLPEGARSTVESLRGEAARVLSRHSFNLADGQRWVPSSAYGALQSRLGELSSVRDISMLLSMSPEEYLNGQMPMLLDSLQRVLGKSRIMVQVDDTVGQRLWKAALDCLTEGRDIAATATCSREALSFIGGDNEADYVRPFRLLQNACKQSRERLANPHSDSQRHREGAPLPTLDVVGGDGLLHCAGSWDVVAAARRQLEQLNWISQLRPREGCIELITLMRRSDSHDHNACAHAMQ